MASSKQRTANKNGRQQQQLQPPLHPPFVMFSSLARTGSSTMETETRPASHVRFGSMSSIGSLSTTDWSGIHVIAEEMEVEDEEDEEHLISPNNNNFNNAYDSPAPTPTISNRKTPKMGHRRSSIQTMTPNYNNFGTTIHDVDSGEETSPLMDLYRKRIQDHDCKPPPPPPAAQPAVSVFEAKSLLKAVHDNKENIDPTGLRNQNLSTKFRAESTALLPRRRCLRSRSNNVHPFEQAKSSRPTKKVMFRGQADFVATVSPKVPEANRSRSNLPFRHRRDSAMSLPSPSRLGIEKANIAALLRGDPPIKSPVLEEYRRKRASLNQVLPIRYPGLKASVQFR